LGADSIVYNPRPDRIIHDTTKGAHERSERDRARSIARADVIGRDLSGGAVGSRVYCVVRSLVYCARKVSHAPAFPDLEKVVYYFLINDLP
jgi:hypothetical protein